MRARCGGTPARSRRAAGVAAQYLGSLSLLLLSAVLLVLVALVVLVLLVALVVSFLLGFLLLLAGAPDLGRVRPSGG